MIDRIVLPRSWSRLPPSRRIFLRNITEPGLRRSVASKELQIRHDLKPERLAMEAGLNSLANEQQMELNGDLVVVQRNPTSGSGRRRKEVDALVHKLEQEGLSCSVFDSRAELDQYVGTQPPNKLRCIVAAGGDGTLASVVNRHPEVPAVMLPQGTENLAAKYFHLSRAGSEIAEVVVSGRVACFDTGIITDLGGVETGKTEDQQRGSNAAPTTRFLLMASAGVDAEVATRLAEDRSGTISHLTYLKPLLGSFWSYGFDLISVQAADAEIELTGTHVIAGNLPPYGLGLPFTPEADGTDGLFDVAVLTCRGRPGSLRYATRLLFGSNWREPWVKRFRCRSLTLAPAQTPRTRIPLQADGDPVRNLPCEINVDPQSMLLVVPESWSTS